MLKCIYVFINGSSFSRVFFSVRLLTFHPNRDVQIYQLNVTFICVLKFLIEYVVEYHASRVLKSAIFQKALEKKGYISSCFMNLS